ncbi:tetratricopeptide repeat protein [Desulfovibrio aminophilus]|uniref:tetratricopeptide repeat protein n=1 Tax=Desulfovibrio aminophilus TaxID=81425 RepID=UPI0033909870
MPRTLALTLAALLLLLSAVRPVPAQELPRVLIQQGERYLAMGKLDAAIASYSKVIACCDRTPEGAEAHNDIGVAYARKGDLDRAIREYETALTINGYPLASFNLGKAWRDRYEQTGDPAYRRKALECFRAFALYLRKGESLPPVVSWQREEIEEYLAEAERTLAE